MPVYRGAMIGLGNVALNGHLPGWKNQVQFKIAAGVDSSQAQRAAFQNALPGAAAFSKLEDAAGSGDLDFVDICTPPHTHFDLALKALKSGLHVLCEKPLVFLPDQMKALEEASSRSGKVLFCVHNWKYAPICRKVSEILKEGTIGEVESIQWYVLREGPAATAIEDKNNWRLNPEKAGGGILIDHGWHAFYLILGWLGREPGKIKAELENRRYPDLPVEDTAKIQMEFPGQSVLSKADIFLTWGSRVRKNSGAFEGRLGRIQMEDDTLKVYKKNGSAADPQSFRFEQPLSQGSHHPDWFGSVIDEFAAELNDGSKKGSNLKMARACLDLIERSKESSRKGTPVP